MRRAREGRAREAPWRRQRAAGRRRQRRGPFALSPPATVVSSPSPARMGACGCGRRRTAACSTSTCPPPTSALPVLAWPGPRRGDARPPARYGRCVREGGTRDDGGGRRRGWDGDGGTPSSLDAWPRPRTASPRPPGAMWRGVGVAGQAGKRRPGVPVQGEGDEGPVGRERRVRHA